MREEIVWAKAGASSSSKSCCAPLGPRTPSARTGDASHPTGQSKETYLGFIALASIKLWISFVDEI